jgi:hypothetical protein
MRASCAARKRQVYAGGPQRPDTCTVRVPALHPLRVAASDCGMLWLAWPQSLGVIDYSLLVGIHIRSSQSPVPHTHTHAHTHTHTHTHTHAHTHTHIFIRFSRSSIHPLHVTPLRDVPHPFPFPTVHAVPHPLLPPRSPSLPYTRPAHSKILRLAALECRALLRFALACSPSLRRPLRHPAGTGDAPGRSHGSGSPGGAAGIGRDSTVTAGLQGRRAHTVRCRAALQE